jgi:hypothetical protein
MTISKKIVEAILRNPQLNQILIKKIKLNEENFNVEIFLKNEKISQVLVHTMLEDHLDYTFEYPQYATIVPDENSKIEPFWINLEFPQYKGTLHLSYKTIKTDSSLYQYFEDSNFIACFN